MTAPKTVRIAAALAPLALAALLVEGELRAEATNSRVSRAIVLFELGRTDLEADRFAEALQKFIDSQQLDPGAGTMLNVAYCFERLGKTATAWADYREAAVLAHEEGKPDWERDALERAEMLEKSLARVVVQVDEPKDGAWPEVMLDDTPLPQSLWGEPTPVDPGRHEVLAKAAARRPWTEAFDVDPERVSTVVVPVLEPATPTTEEVRGAGTGSGDSPRSASGEAHPWTARRKAALVTAGVGVAALGAGAALALVAKSTYASAASDCVGPYCGPDGMEAKSHAFTEANVASIAAATGGAALVGAVILWLAGPQLPGGVGVSPSVGTTGFELRVQRTW